MKPSEQQYIESSILNMLKHFCTTKSNTDNGTDTLPHTDRACKEIAGVLDLVTSHKDLNYTGDYIKSDGYLHNSVTDLLNYLGIPVNISNLYGICSIIKVSITNIYYSHKK